MATLIKLPSYCCVGWAASGTLVGPYSRGRCSPLSTTILHRRSVPSRNIHHVEPPQPEVRRRWRPRAHVEEQEQAMEADEECELVSGSEVKIGRIGAFFVQALKNNNGLGVLVLSDVFGYQNTDTRAFVNELACFGYNVLLPDLFRGVPWLEERDKAEFEDWRSLHPREQVEEDIDAATDWLNRELAGGSDKPDKLALIGFCFGGGRLIETLARDEQGRFGAAAFFYGTRFDPALAARIRIPLLLIAGDGDPLCPVEVVRQLEQAVPGSVAKVYTGRGHAFAHRPRSVDEDADLGDAITNVRHWLHEKLVVPAQESEEPVVEVVGEQGLDF